MGAAAAASPRKKPRKPYTISKAREAWSQEEHAAFVAALKEQGRNWKAIAAAVGTKSVVQVRSHAQKYFIKVQKSGNGDTIPPPRPKRRRSHPPTPVLAGPSTSISAPCTPPPPSSIAAHIPQGPADFSRIYAVLARMIDPGEQRSVESVLRESRMSALDKEIVKLLIGNLEKNIRNEYERRLWLEQYRAQSSAYCRRR